MQERAPTAFVFSLLLHGTVVLAIVTLAFVAHQRTREPIKVLELVAGPPTDPTATAAPALGSPDGSVEVKVPEPPARREPVAVEPVAPPAPKPEVAKPKPEIVKPTARAAKPEATVHAPTRRELDRMTYQQYVKKFGKPTPQKPGAAAAGAARGRAVPKINTKGIAEGVLGGSSSSRGGGGGHAMTTAEHSALDAYFSRMIMVLRQNLEKPPGVSDLLTADVEFFLAADGSISRVRIVRSSGNAEFDAACTDAFARMGSIGPRPDGLSDTKEITFRMKDE